MNLDVVLTLLAQTPDAPLDLAEVVLSLAQDEYPSLDVEAYLSRLYSELAISTNPHAVASVLQLVGPERLLYGSDWCPRTASAAGWRTT